MGAKKAHTIASVVLLPSIHDAVASLLIHFFRPVTPPYTNSSTYVNTKDSDGLRYFRFAIIQFSAGVHYTKKDRLHAK